MHFISTGHLKGTVIKTNLQQLMVLMHSLCPLFLPSWHMYANTMYTCMWHGSCHFLIYCAVELCTERVKFLFKKYSKYLLIFVSPSGTVTGEIRTGLAGWAQSLIICACAEPQLSSWQHSSTCTFASLHEANFKCNFGIRLIRSLIRDKSLCIYFLILSVANLAMRTWASASQALAGESQCLNFT